MTLPPQHDNTVRGELIPMPKVVYIIQSMALKHAIDLTLRQGGSNLKVIHAETTVCIPVVCTSLFLCNRRKMRRKKDLRKN